MEPEPADAEADFAIFSAARERDNVARAAAPAKERMAVRREMEVRMSRVGMRKTVGSLGTFGKSAGAMTGFERDR